MGYDSNRLIDVKVIRQHQIQQFENYIKGENIKYRSFAAYLQQKLKKEFKFVELTTTANYDSRYESYNKFSSVKIHHHPLKNLPTKGDGVISICIKISIRTSETDLDAQKQNLLELLNDDVANQLDLIVCLGDDRHKDFASDFQHITIDYIIGT